MARIAGVNLPTNKRVIIALTYIHGIGRTTAVKIADKLGLDHSRRVQDLSDAEVLQIRETIDAEQIDDIMAGRTPREPRDWSGGTGTPPPPVVRDERPETPIGGPAADV